MCAAVGETKQNKTDLLVLGLTGKKKEIKKYS